MARRNCAIAGVAASWFMSPGTTVAVSTNAAKARKEIAVMKSHGLEYSELFKILSYLDKQNKMANGGVSINQIIDESESSHKFLI